jgi:hypothetical protein
LGLGFGKPTQADRRGQYERSTGADQHLPPVQHRSERRVVGRVDDATIVVLVIPVVHCHERLFTPPGSSANCANALPSY